ncbi:ribokinase [Curtobacterium sp. ME26]|uniref:ribokinase n=1 Tax=Curtobacterium sp. ME26 TaxID=2744254 RepID=UPI001C714D76|nr:ribokinase [Curtobacterium sp. ME26]
MTVVGSINVDDSISVQRHPAPGETTTATSAVRTLGGKGANQAVAAARAGADVRMVGAVAADEQLVRAALDADGVDTSAVAALRGASTGRAIVLVDEGGENSIVVIPGANAAIPSDSIDRTVGAMRPGDVLVLQNEIPAADSARAARLGHARGATVIWNAAPAPDRRADIVDDVDLLVVNEHELAQVAALVDLPADELDLTLSGVARALGTAVVCTLGAAGVAFRHGAQAGRVPAHRVHAADTTAAGDTFVGSLAATNGRPFDERLRLAVAASAITVTRPGAASSIPTRQDVDEFLAAADAQTRTNA